MNGWEDEGDPEPREWLVALVVLLVTLWGFWMWWTA